MSTTFHLLNHAMLHQVLHELRHGHLQRCKALGLSEQDLELLQSLPPAILSHLAYSPICWVEVRVDITVLRRLIEQAERDEQHERMINRALKLGASSTLMYRHFGLDHSETALRRRLLKLDVQRGRPPQLSETQEHALWRRWCELRDAEHGHEVIDLMLMLAEEQQISLTVVWQQVQLYGGASC